MKETRSGHVILRSIKLVLFVIAAKIAISILRWTRGATPEMDESDEIDP